MFTPDEIAIAVEANRFAAADALSAVQLLDRPDAAATGARKVLVADALDAMADQLGEPRGEFWVGRIEAKHLLPSFARALSVRGVEIDLDADPMDETHVDTETAARFPAEAMSFRCRILRGGALSGSGVLVGPSTVLTAWHVVAPSAAYDPAADIAGIEVRLSDGHTYTASVIAFSPCSESEFGAKLPSDDGAVADLHDMALLKLDAPAGAALGYARLPATPTPYRKSSPMFLVHYPNGVDCGLGSGVTGKIRSITSRVGHSVQSLGGSSGGGCFDTKRQLIGIHQGKQTNGNGRYVPLERFVDKARDIVTADVAPPNLWSSDDTPDGRLVIGRRSLFQSFAAATVGGRVRGIHVKRTDPEGEAGQLEFTYDILQSLIARNPGSRLCRITLGTLIEDIPAEIVRRVADIGLAVGTIEERPGVATGETAPEAVGADRGARAADMVERAAAGAGVILWLFFDQPRVSFGDEQRSALEGFIARLQRMEHLRIVVAGLEAAAVPGQDYYPGGAAADGAVGLMVDYVRGFGRVDVLAALKAAASAAKRDIDDAEAGALADQALAGLASANGIYAPSLSASVADRLAADVRALFEDPANG
ncbi:trypsin-like peptidase [Sphingomonas sp. PP-F2F-A104-K0414]|uniref:trypsin-like serine peptidase n=1 Tax=Sphingomonas sp. PP-F2F-A104-K0414 TaxID=2135661 RepID=UPI001042D8C3|nr:trypsin-like peptidase domain-containing protein [Sphingomonas sp. PP-F2F-A104-K0414]TCP96744.1 trypsin-like peptidase [Sphingomonas sp. PP-F2F-A104-K0414]